MNQRYHVLALRGRGRTLEPGGQDTKHLPAWEGLPTLKTKQITTLPPNEGEKTGSTPEKKQAKQVKQNALAMANFTMTFKSETLVSIIYKSQSTKWLTGETHVVVLQLLEKYQPMDVVASIKMQEALTLLKMSEDENPAVFFDKMCHIESQYHKTITKEEKWPRSLEGT